MTVQLGELNRAIVYSLAKSVPFLYPSRTVHVCVGLSSGSGILSSLLGHNMLPGSWFRQCTYPHYTRVQPCSLQLIVLNQTQIYF